MNRMMLLAFVVSTMFVHAETMLWKEESPGFLRAAFVLSPQAFNERSAQQICERVLERNKAAHFVQIQIFADESDARPLPKPSHGVSYDYWRRWYDAAASHPRRLAELTAVHNSAVLRFRGSDGNVSEVVLRGSNPLLLSTSKSTLEILFIGFRKRARLGYNAVDVYMKSRSALDLSDAAEGFWKVAGWFPGYDVFLHVRNDFWFILDPNFPFYYPFDPGIVPPTAKEFENSATVNCNKLSGLVSCRIG